MSTVRDREQAKQLIRAWWHRNGVNADHGAENVAIQAAEAAGWQSPGARECARLRSERDQLRQLVQQVRNLRISDSHLPEQIAELQDRIDESRLLDQTSNEEEHGT